MAMYTINEFKQLNLIMYPIFGNQGASKFENLTVSRCLLVFNNAVNYHRYHTSLIVSILLLFHYCNEFLQKAKKKESFSPESV